MVCIAAFIILALIGIFVAIISIFKPKVGKAYLKSLKKAWGCLWKKVRLQKCETGFKDDVKNTLLSRIMLKHPKWVKPLSIIIEVLSIVIVVVAVWAIVVAIKSLLALWVFESCNVTKPSACTMGAEICSIDEAEPSNPLEATGRWFTEWGEIFGAIPDKFKSYNPDEYNFNYIDVSDNPSEGATTAVDIFDPGCLVCKQSFNNQLKSGFFEKYNVRLVPFPIRDGDGNYKFKNSELVVRYMFAVEQVRSRLSLKILDKIFNGVNSEGIPYQTMFNEEYSHEEAEHKLQSWLSDFGLNADEIQEVKKISETPEIADKINQNQTIVLDQLNAKGIPTMIYDNSRHTGLYKQD